MRCFFILKKNLISKSTYSPRTSLRLLRREENIRSTDINISDTFTRIMCNVPHRSDLVKLRHKPLNS